LPLSDCGESARKKEEMRKLFQEINSNTDFVKELVKSTYYTQWKGRKYDSPPPGTDCCESDGDLPYQCGLLNLLKRVEEHKQVCSSKASVFAVIEIVFLLLPFRGDCNIECALT